MLKNTVVIVLVTLLLLSAFITLCTSEQPVSAQTLIDTIKVGEGGYGIADIAVNPINNLIYVANRDSSNISVVDGATNTVLATVLVGNVPTGVAINPTTNRIYTSNRDNNRVTVINGATNTYMSTISVGSSPGAIAVNSATNLIYVANWASNTVSVIDGTTNTIVATISVGSSPGAIAVNSATNLIYVANVASNTVSVIDGTTNTVVATVAVSSGPRDVAVNPSTNRIYVADNGSNISVIDGTTNTIVATVSRVGYSAVAVNPITNRIYTTGSSTVYVTDGATNTIVTWMFVGNASELAINPSTNRIYVADNGSNISVIDGTTNTVVATMAVGSGPVDIAVNPITNRIYTANEYGRTVSVIDGTANDVMTTVSQYPDARCIAVNPTSNDIYVSYSRGPGPIQIISGTTNTFVGCFSTNNMWNDIAVNPATNRVYASGSGGISVFDGNSRTILATVSGGFDHIAVNPATNRVYAISGSYSIAVINGITNTIETTIPVIYSPDSIAVNSATNRIYVTHTGSSYRVSVIDGAANCVLGTVTLGSYMYPMGISVNPSTNRIYVIRTSVYSFRYGDVRVIDGNTNTTVATVPIGNLPEAIAVNPTSNRIYVANYWDDTVSVILDPGPPDATPPTIVTDLALSETTSNSVTLAWTAPGGDGNVGTATTYDIRYSINNITECNWGSAIQCTGEPAPQLAGSQESFIVTGLSPNTTYYFALKTADEVPNWSGLSNVVQGTTSSLPDTTPPANITDLAVYATTTNSAILTWIAPGGDGNVGTAITYDIRYSTDNITETNWVSVNQCANEPLPQPAGSSENFTVSGLNPGTTYYFALKTADEVPNWSGLSNVATDTTTVGSKRRPVLLVHGFQFDIKHPWYTHFNPAVLWETMAEVLTGNSSEAMTRVIDPTHTWYKLDNKSEDDFIVYISNYSYAIEGPSQNPTLDDIRCYAQNLAQEIMRIKEDTGCNKVDIVAHSMGGLVARAYIEGDDFSSNPCPSPYRNDVGKLIMLGTPNHGQRYALLDLILNDLPCLPQFISALLSDQWDQVESCLSLSDYISASQMLPVPPVSRTPWGSFLITLNSGVTGQQLGVDYKTIAGNLYSCGTSYDQSLWSLFLEEIYTRIKTMLDGKCNDGVVTTESVALPNVEPHMLELDHTSLRDCLGSCIAVKQMLLERSIYFEPSHTLAFACPVHIVITDEYSRSISDNGTNTIPGASMSADEIIGVTTFYLPPNLSYTVYVNGYDTGDFSVMEQLPLSDKDTLINMFRNIDVTDKTKITFDVVDGQTSRLLKIDYDGDETVDAERNLDVATIVSTRTYPVNTATGSGVVTLQSDGGIISSLTAIDDASLPRAGKPNVSFTHGLFSFNITDLVPSSCVTITITFPSPMPVGTQYWKYQGGVWVNCTSLLGDDDGDNVLMLTICDGGLGDADGLANGIIVDPGGPAVPAVAPASASTSAAPRASPTPPRLHRPAQMSLQYLSVNPQQSSASQPVTITTNVVNTGDEAGNYNIALKINGQLEQQKMVSVGPHGTQPVKFTVTKSQPGTYTIDIAGQKSSFTVVGSGSSTAGTHAGGGLIVILLLVILVLASVVVVLVSFRRPAH